MSKNGELPKKFEEIRSKIEKAVTPYITVKIVMPEGVDKEEFLKLENNDEFLQALNGFVKRWLKRSIKQSRKDEAQN